MLRKFSKKFKYHPNEIIQLFKECGYECFKIPKENLISRVKKINKTKKKINIEQFRLKRIKKINPTTIETMFLFLHKDKDYKILKKIS